MGMKCMTERPHISWEGFLGVLFTPPYLGYFGCLEGVNFKIYKCLKTQNNIPCLLVMKIHIKSIQPLEPSENPWDQPTQHQTFRDLKWRNPHLQKQYGYGVCKGKLPSKQPYKTQYFHFRYLKLLVMEYLGIKENTPFDNKTYPKWPCFSFKRSHLLIPKSANQDTLLIKSTTAKITPLIGITTNTLIWTTSGSGPRWLRFSTWVEEKPRDPFSNACPLSELHAPLKKATNLQRGWLIG